MIISHLLIALSLMTVVSGATIKTLKVPRYLRNGTKPVDLICEFVRGDADEFLAVKWFHSSGSAPVYQWIPEINSVVVGGILQGLVDVEQSQRLSTNRLDELTSRSVIRLREAIFPLNGTFTCYVTSTLHTDQRESRTTIYVQPSVSRIYYTKDRSMLTCRIEGIYPAMSVFIYEVVKRGDLVAMVERVKREELQNTDGTFNITLTTYFGSPPKTQFECWAYLDYDHMVLTKVLYNVLNSVVESDVTPVSSAAGGLKTFHVSLTVAVFHIQYLLLKAWGIQLE